MDCFISVVYFNCVTPANFSSSDLLLELPSFPWSSCRGGVRQEDGFNLDVFLTHPVLVLAALPFSRQERDLQNITLL